MPIVIILGIGAVVYFIGKKSAVAPGPFSSGAVQQAVQQAAQSASVVNPNLSISDLEAQIIKLTPKPVDPLAPKPAPAPIVRTIPVIVAAYTPQEAVAEAKLSETHLNPRDFANTSWLNRLYGEILAMHTLAWNPVTRTFDQWSGNYQPGPNLALIGAGTSLALTATTDVARSVGSSIASSIPFIGSAVSGIVGLFGIISAHHKAAVQRDSNAFNQGLTAAENYLQIIGNAVITGQSTPDEGIAALDSMYADFLTFTAPARNNKPYCNSVCEAKVQLNALVLYWKAYYTQIVLTGRGTGGTA